MNSNKLIFLLPLVFVSFTNFPQEVRSQLPEFVSNSANSSPIQLTQKLRLPDNGTPTGRRRGGTSRDGCPALNTPITAVVPGEETLGEVTGENSTKTNSKSFLAKTIADYPTFWVYVPQLPTNLRTGEFVLQDNQGNDVYRTPITLSGKSGLISISLPANPQYSLKADNNYHWYFKVYCDASLKISEYFYVDAWVQKVALTPDLENQLNMAKTGKYLVYAENNFWYDAITNLVELRRADAENVKLKDDWVKLLKSVGLEDIAQVPIALL